MWLTACGGHSASKTPPPTVTLVSISITPASPSIALGLTQQFAASGSYSDGSSKDITTSITWSSATTAVATISAGGLATSISPGTSVIQAASGSVSAKVSLTVTPAALVSLTVSPGSASIALGLTQQFTATGVFTDKSSQTLSSGVTWTTSSASVGAISSSGLLSSKATGSLTVTATSASISGTASLTVTPPVLASISVTPSSPTVAAGLTQQFSAAGTRTDGSSQPLTALTWTSSDTTAATITSGGLATSHHPGSVTITAASGAVQGLAQLTIGAPLLTGIAVTPTTAVLQLGSTTPDQFSATGSYSDQTTADISSQVAWTLSNAYIASISASGSALPLRSGFTKVTATLDAFAATVKLTVLSTPRFMYQATDGGQDISRLTINASTGQLTHWGYQSSLMNPNVGFQCVVTDPSSQYAYVTSITDVVPGADYYSEVSAYSIDPVSGTLTSLGAPASLSNTIGCPQFEPAGNFAFAISGIEEDTPQIVTLAKSSSGVLSIKEMTSLPDYATGLAVDPLGKFLYVSTLELIPGGAASLYGFSIDPSTGALTPMNGTPISLPVNTFGQLAFNPSGDYLYLSDNAGTAINGYSVNRTTGSLTAGAASIAPCINPTALQFTPDGSLAFVACNQSSAGSQVSGNLISLKVADTGSLSQAGTASGYLLTSATPDPSGKYLYAISSGANYVGTTPSSYVGGNNSIVTYSINPDGTLTELNETAGSEDELSIAILGGASPLSISTQWLFLTDLTPAAGSTPASSQLQSYKLQADGSLVSQQSSTTLDSAFSLTTLPWHSDLLLASPQAAPNVQAFSFNDTAATLAAGSSFGDGNAPGSLVIDPSGLIAFASDPTAGLVYWYGSQGTPGSWQNLYSAPSVPASFTAEAGAGPVALDPSGNYLFVANQTANSISEFQYAGDAAASPYPLTASPLAIATDPSGNLLFVAESDNRLHMLVINTEGGFTDQADVTLSGVPASIVVEPGDHYVYVAGSNGLNAFAIDQQAGTLTPVTLNLSISLTGATKIYAEPSGQFLYVVAPELTHDGLYGFTIAADGNLTSIGGGSLATVNTVTSVAFRSMTQ
jgi:6-phosphogluconolactonase (cycloisomerase 2 family)